MYEYRNNQIYVLSLDRLFPDDSRKHVVMVTVDKSVVTIDGELLHKSRDVAIVS